MEHVDEKRYRGLVADMSASERERKRNYWKKKRRSENQNERAKAEAYLRILNDYNVMYCITESDIQERAKKRVGGILTDEELRKVKKGIEWGLGEGSDIVFSTAIDEAVKGD